ncbi:hypothetical protein [Nocardiopsis halotolerans]|uniref:hypothetical protein n=1 Tax=Nocardiopsis halotolerans TaxID=124252 RepID=UPI00034C0339|nr:hypothetical protein [Nocardiopsis halotolerans]
MTGSVPGETVAEAFEGIGQILGGSTDATETLASRARRKVRDGRRPTTVPGGTVPAVAGQTAHTWLSGTDIGSVT